jgi:acylphosphatase
VRNLPDGRVEVLAQGEAGTLATFCERLREGPRAARVDDVIMTPVSVDSGLTSFNVRF